MVFRFLYAMKSFKYGFFLLLAQVAKIPSSPPLKRPVLARDLYWSVLRNKNSIAGKPTCWC